MRKKVLLVTALALLAGSAFAQSHPAKYGWKATTTEKFPLSNRAKRTFQLTAAPTKGAEKNALFQIQLTSKFPVNILMEDARGKASQYCHYQNVSGLTAICSVRRDSIARSLVVEDTNEAVLLDGAKGVDALNRVSLTISNYTCMKNCPIP